MSETRGILIYAINNDTFDYVGSAIVAAKRAKKFLNLPVTLVTNEPVDDADIFESVIIIADKGTESTRSFRGIDNNPSSAKWFNATRTSAYNLSPYDKTLLIDADYFIFNDTLKVMFDTTTEFACFDKINDLISNEPDQIRLSQISIPMQWATVIYFAKCDFAKAVFAFMERIKNNWEYYALLYSFRSGSYRNDFSLSIALQALSGYTTKVQTLPGKLHTIFTNVNVVRVGSDGEVVLKYASSIQKVINTSVHCMNKLTYKEFDYA